MNCHLEWITWSRRMTPNSSRIGIPTGRVNPSVLMPSAPVAVAKAPESPVGSFAHTAAIAGLRPRPLGSHGAGVATVPQLAGWIAAPAQSVTAPGFKLYSTPPKARIPSFILHEGTRREISVELLNRRPS